MVGRGREGYRLAQKNVAWHRRPGRSLGGVEPARSLRVFTEELPRDARCRRDAALSQVDDRPASFDREAGHVQDGKAPKREFHLDGPARNDRHTKAGRDRLFDRPGAAKLHARRHGPTYPREEPLGCGAGARSRFTDEEPLVGERLRGKRGPAHQRMVWRSDRHKPIQQERGHLAVEITWRIGHHREIAGMVDQATEHAVAVLHAKGDVDRRLRPMKRPQGRRNDVDPGGRIRAEIDRPAPASTHLGHRPRAIVEPVDDVIDRLQEDLTDLGQRNGPAVSLEEPDAELVFQRPNLMGHCGLGDRELAGCCGEAERPGNRLEQSQAMQVPVGWRRGDSNRRCTMLHVWPYRHVLDSIPAVLVHCGSQASN